MGKWKKFSGKYQVVTIITVLVIGAIITFMNAHASGGISIDVSVNTHASSNGTTIKSPAFSTSQSKEVVLAFISSDGPNTKNGQSFSSVTGAGLTWTLRQRSNTQAGTAEIWQAVTTTTLSNATVTATRSQGSYHGSIDVVSFAGADTTTNGAVASANASTGASTISLTTTRNNSWIWATGNDYDSASSHTVGSGQTMFDQYLDKTTGDSYWTQYQTNVTATSGTRVTLNNTAPTKDRWNFAAIEILPAQASDTTPPSIPTSLNATPMTGTEVDLSWTASTDDVATTGYNIYRNGAKIATSSTNSYQDKAVSPGNTYSYTVSAYDAAGNTSAQSASAQATTPQVFTPPIVSINSQPASITNNATATFTFNASNNSDPAGQLTYQCSLDGASAVSCTSPQTYSSLTDGSHTFSVTVTDTNDGLTSNPATYNWSVDATAPSATINSPIDGSTVSGQVPVSIDANDNANVASVQVQLDGTNVGSPLTSAPYSYNWNTSAITNGQHALTAVVIDTAGNTTTSSPINITVSNTGIPPTNTAEPVITGTVATGGLLATSTGSWSNSPTSYSYQWQLCGTDGTNCANINGATSQSYTVAASDAGHTFTVQVTASNGSGSSSVAAPIVPVIDEFNGTGVDNNIWTVMNQQGDTSNNEQECYLPTRVGVNSGFMTETVAYNNAGFTCPAGTPSYPNCVNACANPTKYYESGAVQMKSVAFTYGTVVVRAKFPGAALTTWPAIWLLGAACQQPNWLTPHGTTGGGNCAWSSDNQDSAEIDIAEGNTGSTTSMLENLYNSSANYGNYCQVSLSDYSTNWHTYELDWQPGSLVFKIDGQTTNCGYTGSAVPSHPMFLIINSAIVNNRVPVSTDLPQTMYVDYVHISH